MARRSDIERERLEALVEELSKTKPNLDKVKDLSENLKITFVRDPMVMMMNVLSSMDGFLSAKTAKNIPESGSSL